MIVPSLQQNLLFCFSFPRIRHCPFSFLSIHWQPCLSSCWSSAYTHTFRKQLYNHLNQSTVMHIQDKNVRIFLSELAMISYKSIICIHPQHFQYGLLLLVMACCLFACTNGHTSPCQYSIPRHHRRSCQRQPRQTLDAPCRGCHRRALPGPWPCKECSQYPPCPGRG